LIPANGEVILHLGHNFWFSGVIYEKFMDFSENYSGQTATYLLKYRGERKQALSIPVFWREERSQEEIDK